LQNSVLFLTLWRSPKFADATLICHRRAREVARDELAGVACPPAEGRWRPVPHSEVLSHAEQALINAGYAIDRMSLALFSDDARFFGTLMLLRLSNPVIINQRIGRRDFKMQIEA